MPVTERRLSENLLAERNVVVTLTIKKSQIYVYF